MADVEVFDNLAGLDGLIQGKSRPKSYPTVGTAKWDVELGLVEENKWWKGSWSKDDIIRQVEKPATEKRVEYLAQKLASLISSGELSIKGWSDSHPKDLRLMFGSEVGVDLKKLPDDEGSTRALVLLKKIALRAQLRDCQVFKASASEQTSGNGDSKDHTQEKVEALDQKKHELEEAQKRIKELEIQVSVVRQMIVAERETTKSVAPKPPPGASRANPTRQKRKIVEAEFESD